MIEGVDINWDTIPVSSPVIKLVHVANFNELNAVNVVGKLMCCIVFACYVGFGQHKLMRVHKKAVYWIWFASPTSLRHHKDTEGLSSFPFKENLQH